MSYDQFGLDALKSGWDQGDTTGVFYDPWSWQQVGGRQFYLCFANWVISRTTIDAFLKQEPVEALEGDRCQKCREAKERMHYCIEGLEELNRDIGICHECVQWANDYLSKPEPPPPPGTQLTLLDSMPTRIDKPRKAIKSVPGVNSKPTNQTKLF